MKVRDLSFRQSSTQLFLVFRKPRWTKWNFFREKKKRTPERNFEFREIIFTLISLYFGDCEGDFFLRQSQLLHFDFVIVTILWEDKRFLGREELKLETWLAVVSQVSPSCLFYFGKPRTNERFVCVGGGIYIHGKIGQYFYPNARTWLSVQTLMNESYVGSSIYIVLISNLIFFRNIQ